MEKNCLVTTLKAKVNADLPRYGKVRVYVHKGDNPDMSSLWVHFDGNGTLTLSSEGVGTYKSGISGELNDNPLISNIKNEIDTRWENKDGYAFISKYPLTKVVLGAQSNVNIKDLKGIGSLKEIYLRGTYQEVDGKTFREVLLENASTIITFNVRSANKTNVHCMTKEDVQQLINLEEVSWSCVDMFTTDFKLSWINSPNVKTIEPCPECEMKDFAKFTKLQKINFGYAPASGDIMDFITPWIASGRTSGSVIAEWIGGEKYKTVLTYNGRTLAEAFPDLSYVQTSKISWTSDGTVTITNS